MLSDPSVVRRGERIVRGLAGRFKSPRDDALVSGAEAAYTFLTGRRIRGGSGISSHREPRINVVALRSAQAALDAGDVRTALERIDHLYRDHPDSMRVLRLRREVLARQGVIVEQARMLHEMHLLDGSPERLESERLLLGRLVETAPGWLPRIPGPVRPVSPDSDDVVLHLLKESAPELTNGFTMRSRYNLLAAKAVGIRPTVVTALGFPRLLGVENAPALVELDGIPHHRLDLGPHYPVERPFDQLLEDQAWLTAGIARQVQPALIHASSGHRGFETALVGLAVRAHIRRPMVYEVRSFFEATWSADADWNESGEQYHRRFDAESGAMQAADHVITIAESMRADIVSRGVPEDRVTVIPNGVDADSFTPEPPDPALRQRYGLDGKFVFGYVSNLDHPRENQELLVAATSVLLKRGRRVACLIVGDGKRRQEVERIARKAGVRDAVVFTGKVPHDQVRACYALLDAFVVPRRDERAARTVTPLKPYEALAMERPLVVADLPALTEIAEPDKRGLSFRPDDAEDLATALERLIDDPALRERIGREGREWVIRERSWATNGGRIRDVYREVLERWTATAAADGAGPGASAAAGATAATPATTATRPRTAKRTRAG